MTPVKAFLSIVHFTWLEAVRTRLLWFGLSLVIVTALVAEFSAALAITESSDFRIEIYAALVRLSLVLLVTLFVASSVTREFQERLLDLVLSRPVPRAWWVVGRFVGFGLTASILAALATLPLLLHVAAAPVALWSVSLWAELCLVAAACLACAITLQQVTAAVTAVAGFYVLARAMTAIVLMSQGPAVDTGSVASTVIATMINWIAHLLPALDRFAPTMWMTAPISDPTLVLGVLFEAAVFSALLLAVGLFDFYRRDF